MIGILKRLIWYSMLRTNTNIKIEDFYLNRMHRHKDKTKEELIIELNELKKELNSLKLSNTNTVANKKLLESEENYRYLFDNNPQPMWIYDIESLRFLEVNNATIYHYGYSREEFLGMTIKDIRPEEDLEALQKDIALTKQTYNLAGEWRHLKKNGEIIFVEIISHEITINNRKARHVMANDITIQKRAIEDRTETLLRYNALVEQAGDAFFVHDFEGKFIEVNQQACDTLGYSKEELLKLSVTDVEMDFDLKSAKKEWAKIESGHQFTLSGHQRRKDGTVFPVEVRFGCSEWKGQKLFLGLARDITDRKKAEEILEESHALIKVAGEKAKLGGWNVNIGENRVYWSDEVAAIHERSSGYAPSVEEGINFYAPEWHAKIKKAFANCVGKGISFDEEMQIITASGKRVWVNTIGEAVRDDKGKIVKVQGAFQDISERKRAEESLRESEENLAITLNSIGDGVIATDLNGMVVKMNPIAEKLCGWSLNDAAGKLLTEVFNIVNASSRETAINPVKKVLENGEIVGLANGTILISKNGTEYQISDSAAPIKNKEGKISGVVLVFSDVTEKYLTAQSLIENEELVLKLSRAVEQSPASIILTDTKGNIEYANPKTLKVTGYELSELIGKNPNIFSSGEKPKEAYKVLWQKITSGNEWQGEFHNKKKNGELYWEHASISPILNKDGEITHYLAVKEDITERKQILEDLIIAKEQAEQSDKLKSAFLANMSHEIRTPMNSILGFTELLKAPELSGEKQQKYISVIQKGGTRLLNIINDIVDISKIEAGLMKADIKASNLKEQIKFIHTFFKPEVEKKGLQLLVNNSSLEKDLMIETDPEKVYAIFTNLIKNAIKFTNKGFIAFDYERKGNYLEFYVKDTGIGIPKDKHEDIFERFIQADISDKMALQGAGLGLSITKAYVELLGGKIWVESEVENLAIGKPGGTTIYFTIPFNMGTILDTNTHNDMLSGKTGMQSENLKILIAEDDEASAIYLSVLIEEYSSEILMAKNGMEAVEIYKNNPDIDLILMDMQMPYLNGYEATGQIRQLNKKVVIIAQTAFALSYDRQKVIDAGCNDYIPKPILTNDLTALIKKYFN